jgi:hypothetical protein
VLRNIEDHAVRILELALKVAMPLVAKVEEELAARRLDLLLGLRDVLKSFPLAPAKFNRAMLITPSLM